jgi:hypothetical protein
MDNLPISFRKTDIVLVNSWNRHSEAHAKARPKGRGPIQDYLVEDHADHVLHTSATQEAAITWAKKAGYSPHIARVRTLNDKNKPDHWRAV